MPAFLEKKLKQEYGAASDVPYRVMNSLGAMSGNKITPKGKAMDAKHAKDLKAKAHDAADKKADKASGHNVKDKETKREDVAEKQRPGNHHPSAIRRDVTRHPNMTRSW